MKRWEVKIQQYFVWPGQDNAALDELLEQGWEPFGVHSDRYYCAILLRREVKG